MNYYYQEDKNINNQDNRKLSAASDLKSLVIRHGRRLIGDPILADIVDLIDQEAAQKQQEIDEAKTFDEMTDDEKYKAIKDYMQKTGEENYSKAAHTVEYERQVAKDSHKTNPTLNLPGAYYNPVNGGLK